MNKLVKQIPINTSVSKMNSANAVTKLNWAKIGRPTFDEKKKIS